MTLSIALMCLLSAAGPIDTPQTAHPPAAAVVAHQLSTNAALIYSRAWLLQNQETMALVRQEISPPGQCVLDERWVPTPALTEALVAEQPIIARLMAAAAVEYCDFGTDQTDGPDRLLPHLGKFRDSARLLRADAIRLLTANDLRGAAERVAAMYAISRHTTGDNVAIGSLIAASIRGNADATTLRLCNEGLDDTTRRHLFDLIAGFDAGDPVGLKNSLQIETGVLLKWAKNFDGSDAGAQLCQSSLLESMNPQEQQAFRTEVGTMDGDAAQRMFKEYARATDELLSFINADDARAKWDDFKVRIESGAFGSFAKAQRSSLSAVVATHWEALALQHDTLKALKHERDPNVEHK